MLTRLRRFKLLAAAKRQCLLPLPLPARQVALMRFLLLQQQQLRLCVFSLQLLCRLRVIALLPLLPLCQLTSEPVQARSPARSPSSTLPPSPLPGPKQFCARLQVTAVAAAPAPFRHLSLLLLPPLCASSHGRSKVARRFCGRQCA